MFPSKNRILFFQLCKSRCPSAITQCESFSLCLSVRASSQTYCSGRCCIGWLSREIWADCWAAHHPPVASSWPNGEAPLRRTLNPTGVFLCFFPLGFLLLFRWFWCCLRFRLLDWGLNFSGPWDGVLVHCFKVFRFELSFNYWAKRLMSL